MRQDNKDPFQKAYETSGRLLSRRPHSVYELSTKLRQREFSREVIDETISKLKSCNFLDDARFAGSYFEELKAKGFGVRRIKLAMKKRGIRDELLSGIISEGLSEDDELESAVALLLKRKLHFAREEDRLKRRMKMFRYLASRGFPSSVISRAVGKYNNMDG
jgi:regulatory protein